MNVISKMKNTSSDVLGHVADRILARLPHIHTHTQSDTKNEELLSGSSFRGGGRGRWGCMDHEKTQIWLDYKIEF